MTDVFNETILSGDEKTIIKESEKEKIKKIIEKFNKKEFSDPEVFYYPEFKRGYLYLMRNEFGEKGPICRLKYNGNIKDWDFEVFKYSSETFTDDIFFMPGEEEIDGTIEGAMKAGLELYPI